jgi:Tol biopolymer transport system component
VVFDVSSGARTTVLESAHHVFEAPNWTPDGANLIVNQDGAMHLISADGSGHRRRIDTGAINTANNDHLLSPTGDLLYLSAGDGHIHAVELATGTVRRVTNDHGDDFIHYLHGVSPDGALLAYIGFERRTNRSPLTNVFTIPSAGGADNQLTRSEKPHDGSEFSPDGEWIYFNSERNSTRAGHAQLFRMRRDGSDIAQLTFDERVNWFPHLSPDGQRLIYISFEPGVEGHPANENVVIRLTTPDGGTGEDIVRLFGGQGTINVNSWAPDSTRFAYVEYPTTTSTG